MWVWQQPWRTVLARNIFSLIYSMFLKHSILLCFERQFRLKLKKNTNIVKPKVILKESSKRYKSIQDSLLTAIKEKFPWTPSQLTNLKNLKKSYLNLFHQPKTLIVSKNFWTKNIIFFWILPIYSLLLFTAEKENL